MADAVGSSFRRCPVGPGLSPFVQFVGRIMRAIEQNAPGHPLNQGVVVFHVGANVARRWDDFRQFSQADQEFFANLLPEAEDVPFDGEHVRGLDARRCMKASIVFRAGGAQPSTSFRLA